MPFGPRSLRFRSSILPLVGGTSLITAMIAVSVTACGSKKGGTFDNGTGGGDDASTGDDSGGFTGSSGGTSSGFNIGPGTGGTGGTNSSMCKGGFYEGQFGGLYSSHLTFFGVNIPVTGDVRLTLQQMGSGTQTCTFQGESESCSNIFSVKNGTIDGVADMVFPYHCTLTGTLGCKEKKLVGGWINCTYCAIGPLDDAGNACVLGGTTDGGMAGAGGQFGGPLTADYFYNSTGGDAGAGAIDGGGKDPAPAFGTVPPPLGANMADYDPGAWNGSEALADYSGTGPLPDGGTVGDYISDAGYGRVGVPNDFGGYGWWYATYQHP